MKCLHSFRTCSCIVLLLNKKRDKLTNFCSTQQYIKLYLIKSLGLYATISNDLPINGFAVHVAMVTFVGQRILSMPVRTNE